MKRSITCLIVMTLALATAACLDNGYGEPVLIERGILTDAVWGNGLDIPADAVCIADSKLTFEGDVNPLTVAINDMENGIATTPFIIVSDVYIRISELAWNTKAGACDGGNLHYLISASHENPLEVEEVHPRCKLKDIATKAGADIPIDLTVRGHLEACDAPAIADDLTAHSIKLVLDYCATGAR